MPSNGSSGLCWAHDPKNREKRRRGQSRGGKNKLGRELVDAKREIRAVIGGVLSGRIERGNGAVALQGFNTLLKAVSVEVKLREVEELERRLEALEELYEEERRGGYGA